MAVLVLNATPFQMGILAAAGGFVSLVCGPAAGLCVDRYRHRPILIFADLGRAAALASIPLAAVFHVLSMAQLYIVVTVAALLDVLFDVAYQSYLPALVARENLLEGNSKLALSNSIAETFGPGITGVLVQWLTSPIAILLDALSFLASALTVWLIRKPEARTVPRHPSRFSAQLTAGWRAVIHFPMRRALAGHSATAGFFGGFFASLYVLYAIRYLHLTPVLLGAVVALGGLGNMLGATLAGRVMRRFGLGATLIGSALVMGASSFLISLAHGSILMATLFLMAAQIGDVGWPVYNVCELTFRQEITPSELLGRVNSIMQTIFRSLLPLGSLCAGALAGWIGIRPTLATAAAGLLLSTLWLIFSPLRTMRDYPPATAADSTAPVSVPAA